MLFAMTASADAKQQTVPDTPPAYNVAALQGYLGAGEDRIAGRAVVDTKTFGPVIYANAKIYLLPLTDYAVWWVHKQGDALTNGDDRPYAYPDDLRNFNRVTKSNNQGYFEFDNLPQGSYLIEMLVDYESDTDRVETRTVYAMSDDDFPTSFTTQHIKTKLRRELDYVAASGTFTRPDERLELETFHILGIWTCCRGEI